MSSPTRYRVYLLRFLASFCFLVGLSATPAVAAAGDDPKSPAPAAKSKWLLPPHYEELDLSDEQKARVTRILEVYNPKVNNLINVINKARENGAVGSALITLSLTLQKLRNDRQRLLNEVLTQEQRDKFRELSGGK